MVEQNTPVSSETHSRYAAEHINVTIKRIAWGAVFAGVIVSMVTYLLLTILGTAIGTSTIDPLREQNPMDNIGIGAAVWTGLSMLIAVAAGGYISGRLAHREGALHGVLMFGVNTLICAWFVITLANSAVSGTMNILGAGLKAAGSGAQAIAPSITETVKDKANENNINLDSIQNELETTLRQTGKPELQPERIQNKAEQEISNAQQQTEENSTQTQRGSGDDLTSFFNGLIDRNEATFQAVDRDALKNIIKARTGKNDAEAEQLVTQTEQKYQAAREKYEELKQQAEQKSRELGEKAAAATAKAAWFTFFMLIVEAVLAGVMGMLGRRSQPVLLASQERA